MDSFYMFLIEPSVKKKKKELFLEDHKYLICITSS